MSSFLVSNILESDSESESESEIDDTTYNGFGRDIHESEEEEELEVFVDGKKRNIDRTQTSIKTDSKSYPEATSHSLVDECGVSFEIEYVPFSKALSCPFPRKDTINENDLIDCTVVKEVRISNSNEVLDDEFDFDKPAISDRPPISLAGQKKKWANPNQKFDVWKAASVALSEITSIYSDGLGDNEVRQLDDHLLESQKEGSLAKLHGETKSIVGPETIEEGDEDEFLVSEALEEKANEILKQEAQKLSELWNELGDEKGLDLTVPEEKEAVETKENSMKTYLDVFRNLRKLDLSEYLNDIDIGQNGNDKSKSFWIGNMIPSVVRDSLFSVYKGSKENLQFPFLLAHLNYSPDIKQHLNLLQMIYTSLLEIPSTTACLAIGPHWESIGFQGLDPRTDLNRSMKMLSLLLTFKLIESNVPLKRAAFNLSRYSSQFLKSSENETALDLTWPFMCVSIMFTKEALQTLRRGALNHVLNESQMEDSVINALAEFHQSCFFDFAKRLISDPTKHHAMHLSELRKEVANHPDRLLKNYRRNARTPTVFSSLTYKMVQNKSKVRIDDEDDVLELSNIDNDSFETENLEQQQQQQQQQQQFSVFRTQKLNKFVIS